MAKKIHKLALSVDTDYLLIGISSHENDYRITWALNNQLDIQLSRQENYWIENKKRNEYQQFALYSWADETGLYLYNLLSNRCDNGFLLEEHKNIDYLIQIFGEFSTTFVSNLLQNLKEIQIISMAFVIDTTKLKSKKKLPEKD